MALALFLSFGPRSVAADEATPLPSANVPDPSLCTVEPPSRAQLNAEIIGATTALQGTPGARLPGRLESDVVPTGVPADDPTIAAITATIRELVACFNAGEPLRALGLYTTTARGALYVRQGPLSGDAYEALATPLPAPAADRDEILAIRTVRLLPDGRVGATVTIAYAVVPEPKTFFFVFARAGNGERWLIDGILGELSFSVP